MSRYRPECRWSWNRSLFTLALLTFAVSAGGQSASSSGAKKPAENAQKSSHTLTIFLSGALRTTGEAQIRQDTTLVEQLSRAKWLDNANLTQILLIHQAKNSLTRSDIQIIDVDKYIKTPADKPLDSHLNLVLHDKDQIYVPFKTISEATSDRRSIDIPYVYVVGAVIKPGKIVFDKSTMTLSEAITAAGGVTAMAMKKNCVIARGFDTGDIQAIKFNWDDVQKGKVKDIPLLPGDCLFIQPKNRGFESPLIYVLPVLHPPWAYDLWWVPLDRGH